MKIMTIKLNAARLSFLGSLAIILAGSFFVGHLAEAAASSSVFYEKTPILMYHYIENPTASTTLPGLYVRPEIFENQLCEIKKLGYRTVFVSEVAASLHQKKSAPAKTVSLSFDDGYKDFYTKVFPLLKKYQMKATVYVIVNALDKPGYLTKAQVKELANSGLVEIGSHTFNHLDLRTLPTKKAIYEIKLSKAVLEKMIGRAVLTFCYPAGSHTDQDLRIVSEAGYTGAVSTIAGAKNSPGDIYLLKRLRPNSRSGADFAGWLERESGRKIN